MLLAHQSNDAVLVRGIRYPPQRFQVALQIPSQDIGIRARPGAQHVQHLTFTFVTEGIETAIEQAKAAAGDWSRR